MPHLPSQTEIRPVYISNPGRRFAKNMGGVIIVGATVWIARTVALAKEFPDHASTILTIGLPVVGGLVARTLIRFAKDYYRYHGSSLNNQPLNPFLTNCLLANPLILPLPESGAVIDV